MTTQVQSRFLDLRALASLERMRFTTRHRIEGSYSGCHTSRQQGGAGEFVDYREYSGSEDLRRLDWKVLGRTGKAFVRIHEEETNLLCTLALDASGSMDFRGIARRRDGGSKLQYAQYLSTALAHVISRGQDQVGLALLGSAVAVDASAGGDPHAPESALCLDRRDRCRGPRPPWPRACGSCSSAAGGGACSC